MRELCSSKYIGRFQSNSLPVLVDSNGETNTSHSRC